MENVLLHDYVAGAVGGIAGLVVGHPLDTAKVQMQTKKLTGDGSYRNTMEVVRSLYGIGWRDGFMRGLSFPLVSYGFINCIYFGVYGNTLKFIKTRRRSTSSSRSDALDLVAAGVVAGLAQLTVACPVDAVKVILQSQIEKEGRVLHAKSGANVKFPGPIYCLRQLYLNGGLSNCYRGIVVMSLRDLPSSAIYFVTYDRTKVRLRALGFGDKGGLLTSLVAGGWAGVVSWIIILPLDVVKSHFQMDYDRRRYRGLWDCVRTIYRAGGLSAFYAGLVPCILRAFPTNAIILTVNAECLRLLGTNWFASD